MDKKYAYNITLVVAAIIGGTLWYVYHPFQPNSPRLDMPQISPASIVSDPIPVNFLSSIKAPGGWRTIEQNSSTAEFSDLPAGAVLYDNADAQKNGDLSSDTLGYSDIVISRMSATLPPMRSGASYLSPPAGETDLDETQEVLTGKTVETENLPLPGDVYGLDALVSANMSTVYRLSIAPYVPSGTTSSIILSSSDLQTFHSFVAGFAAQLP